MTVQFSNNLSFYGRGNQGIDAHVSLGSVDMSFVAQKESEMSTGPSLCGGEDIHVSFDGNKLLIKGEKTSSKKDDDKHFISREISYGCYERSILLPITADVSRASASFKKGMLWVIIPKQAIKKSASKEIKIEKA